MNNATFNREQFNDTIKKRLIYRILGGLLHPQKHKYQKPAKTSYPAAEEIKYPPPQKVI